MTYLFLPLGLILLVIGADQLVSGSASLARRWGVKDLVIGLTVMAFGTSMPELVVNIQASTAGQPDIAMGNILGSNIANILLILGVTALITPLFVQKTTLFTEIPIALCAVLMLGYLAHSPLLSVSESPMIGRTEGLILLGGFVIFLAYIVHLTKRTTAKLELPTADMMPQGKATVKVVLGLIGLVAGGWLTVEGAVSVARWAGMDERVIGLTVVAVGTSLPELFASAVAAYRGNADLAVGNIIGSNIFNVFWILGCSAVITPLPVSPSVDGDLAWAAGATILLVVVIMVAKKRMISRLLGAILLLTYGAYLWWVL